MSDALKITNLSFHFNEQSDSRFFGGVNASFPANALHFIRGKNGAGKSTLFRIIRGQVFSDEFIEGTICIGEKEYKLTNQERRKALANTVRMVSQKFDHMLADQFTFTQNLQLATMPHNPHLETFKENYTIPKLVERFGIDFEVPVGMLSGGQRQILAILMALQKPTSILLLDEPTAALDDKNGAMVMSFIKDLLKANKKLTVLIICHDMDLVEEYATRDYYFINVADDDTRTIERTSLKS